MIKLYKYQQDFVEHLLACETVEEFARAVKSIEPGLGKDIIIAECFRRLKGLENDFSTYTDIELEKELRTYHILVNSSYGAYGQPRYKPEDYQHYLRLRAEYIKRSTPTVEVTIRGKRPYDMSNKIQSALKQAGITATFKEEQTND